MSGEDDDTDAGSSVQIYRKKKHNESKTIININIKNKKNNMINNQKNTDKISSWKLCEISRNYEENPVFSD